MFRRYLAGGGRGEKERTAMIDLPAGDTRVFLFHSADAAGDPGGAMDRVNTWLGKDRSGGPYANLRVRNISVTDDGKGCIYTVVVCSLGRVVAAADTP
jgi:hypothetical protein